MSVVCGPLIPSAEWPLHRHDGGLVESQASTSVSLKWAQNYIINMNVRFIINHMVYIMHIIHINYYTNIGLACPWDLSRSCLWTC